MASVLTLSRTQGVAPRSQAEKEAKALEKMIAEADKDTFAEPEIKTERNDAAEPPATNTGRKRDLIEST